MASGGRVGVGDGSGGGAGGGIIISQAANSADKIKSNRPVAHCFLAPALHRWIKEVNVHFLVITADILSELADSARIKWVRIK
jgi:hypothetical protein